MKLKKKNKKKAQQSWISSELGILKLNSANFILKTEFSQQCDVMYVEL